MRPAKAMAKVITINSTSTRERKYTRLSETANLRLVEELQELIDKDNCSKADYKRLAERFNVSLRTVENRLAKLRKQEPHAWNGMRRTQYTLPDDLLERVATAGQICLVFRELHASGEYAGSQANFYRQCNAEYGNRILRVISRDEAQIRRSTFEKLDQFLFMQGFSLDLVYLRAPLADGPAGAKAVAALVREMNTGVLMMSWIWPTDQVTANDIVVLIAETFRGRVLEYQGEGVFLGGVPDFLRVDNGGQFTSREVGDLLNRLGVRVIPSNPRKSNENGAHERVHRVLREELFALLPGSEDGLRDDRGELMADSRPLISLDEARDLLDRWAWAYNTRAKKGVSRMDAWVEGIDLSAGLLPHRETPKTLARYAIERKHTARRYALGVLVDTVYYTCPEVEEVTNKRFVVRQWLRDERTVELFTPAGTYVGVAAANGQLTAAESGAIQKSAEDARRLRAEVTAASRSKHFVSAFPDVPIQGNGTFRESEGGEADSSPAQSPLSALADALRNRNDRVDLVDDEEGAP